MADEPTNGTELHGPTGAEQLAVLRTLDTAVLLDRLRFANQVGMSFEGKRDLYATLGYPRVISAREYRERYSRGGIAKRIVEAYPKATWRGGVEIYEDEDPDKQTEFEKAFIELDQRLHVWSVLERADILAGLSTYSVILLGDGNDLGSPLQRGKPEDLLYMTPYFGGGGPGSATWRSIATDVDATIFEYEDDPKDPRFGEPRLYSLKRTNVSLPSEAQHVHWTRIIHVAEGCLDDNVFGIPTLENVWNLLDDLDKCTGGGSEAFWLRANAGMQLDVDKDMALQPGEYATVIEKLKADVEAYKHQLTRVLRTRGVDIKQLGSDVANFGPSADAILKQIAGSKGIPLRILTGSEQGQLASGQDAENWNSQVQDRRTNYAGPSMARRLVDRLIKYGYLPTPKQYTVGWPVEEEMTEPQKADLAVKLAQANQTMGDPLFTEAEIREKCFDMKPLTDQQRKEIADRAAEKIKQAQEAMGPAPGGPGAPGQPQLPGKPAQKQLPAGKFPRAAEHADDDTRRASAPVPTDVWTDADRGRAIARARTAHQLAVLGGAGSGNFGHAGRPGEVGGSSSGRDTNPIVTERERVKRYHKMAGTEYRARPVPLYHSTTQTFAGDKPSFDAFYGTEDFQKNFPQEFGPNTYEVILPPDASILDLNIPSEAATNFMTRMSQVAWPNEAPLRMNPADPENFDAVYEAWTDKTNVSAALKGFPYAGVKYQDEYLLPAKTIKGLPARKYAPTTRSDYLTRPGFSLPYPTAASEHPDAELLDVLAEAIAANKTEVIDSIIGVQHKRSESVERQAADLYIHLQQDPHRALGGPGSGNFGHSGRPGEVGGSSSEGGGAESGTSSTGTSTGVPIQSFRDAIHAKGWRTVEVKDLPRDIVATMRTDLKLRQQNALSLTPATVSPVMMEGIQQGLDDIEAKMPDAAAIMKAEVPILVAEYHPDVTATSIISGRAAYSPKTEPTDRDKWLLINVSPPHADANQGERSFNMSQRIASSKTGDDFLRESYRNTMLHESAHIIDALTNHQLTRDTTATMLDRTIRESGRVTDKSTSTMLQYLDKHVSTYAAMSGPMEAAAEIFTAAIRGHQLPPDLHALRDRMLATDLKSRVRKR